MEVCRTKSETSLLVQQNNVNRLDKIEDYIREHKDEVKAGMAELHRVAMEQATRTLTVKTTDERFQNIEARLVALERAVLNQRSKSNLKGGADAPARSSAP